jgi:pimeloyl-ACP methyl ester carboxylesterase
VLKENNRLPALELRSATVDIGNGVHLYYEECGSGPVLLFVHGLWGSCRFFRAQLSSLSARYRVIALDLRGHGRSSMTLSDQTIPTYARDLRAFINQLGLTTFVAVGWSMGAYVWWDYHLQFGVGGNRGLVVIDQPPSDWQSHEIPNALLSFDTLRTWQFRLQTERNAFIREVIPMMFATPPNVEDFEWIFDEMTRAPEAVATAILVDQSLREYQDVLWSYPVPTLVCAGGRSAQPRAGLELLIQRVRNSALVIFETSGHCLFLEEVEKFNAEVDRFAWPLFT